jgi:hypothetical protein
MQTDIKHHEAVCFLFVDDVLHDPVYTHTRTHTHSHYTSTSTLVLVTSLS